MPTPFRTGPPVSRPAAAAGPNELVLGRSMPRSAAPGRRGVPLFTVAVALSLWGSQLTAGAAEAPRFERVLATGAFLAGAILQAESGVPRRSRPVRSPSRAVAP